MIKIIPQVDSRCTVTGYLYDDPDRSILGEDMVEVSLPNGVLVSAGWYPEGDPQGAYRVAATCGLDYLAKMETQQFGEAVELVEDFARRFADSHISTPRH